jgi:predicted phosphodiesterase
MRIAIVSDIHGNLTALEAVVADINRAMPDFVLHGGDLVAGGSQPAEVIDLISQLGWSGVIGNTDEMLWTLARRTMATRARHICWSTTISRWSAA